MLPQTQARKKRNSSKVNLLISFIFHAAIVLVMLYFAARQGWFGKPMQAFSVELVKKEKPPVKPPEPVKPKVEAPKPETPKPAEAAKPVEVPKPVATTEAAPSVAPPAVEVPSFYFGGGKEVISGDPVAVYQSALQDAFLSKWNRPDNMDDENYVAEVAVSVGRDGQISNPVWTKSSGNAKWDDSVRAAVAAVTAMATPPPTNFPQRVTIKFDVVQEETESVLP